MAAPTQGNSPSDAVLASAVLPALRPRLACPVCCPPSSPERPRWSVQGCPQALLAPCYLEGQPCRPAGHSEPLGTAVSPTQSPWGPPSPYSEPLGTSVPPTRAQARPLCSQGPLLPALAWLAQLALQPPLSSWPPGPLSPSGLCTPTPDRASHSDFGKRCRASPATPF